MPESFEAGSTYFTALRLIVEHCLALVQGVPQYVTQFLLKIFEVRATLSEDTSSDPEMIIIQDYLGTIQEENEEAPGP